MSLLFFREELALLADVPVGSVLEEHAIRLVVGEIADYGAWCRVSGGITGLASHAASRSGRSVERFQVECDADARDDEDVARLYHSWLKDVIP
jgi:hypothetical protein